MNAMAAGMVTVGPWSPPMQSMEILIVIMGQKASPNQVQDWRDAGLTGWQAADEKEKSGATSVKTTSHRSYS
jgi:hypothetical protein